MPRPEGLDNPDLRLAAAADFPVLVTARYSEQRIRCARVIHDQDGYARGPFVTAVAAHADGLLWKYEQARGGTLFIDDIATLPSDARIELLSLLERRTAAAPSIVRSEVRIVAGASRPLAGECADDASFARLFYRLNVLHINLID